jgi:hypothetical protein
MNARPMMRFSASRTHSSTTGLPLSSRYAPCAGPDHGAHLGMGECWMRRGWMRRLGGTPAAGRRGRSPRRRSVCGDADRRGSAL